MKNATSKKVVLDTNTLISGAIIPGSTPAKAIDKAFAECVIFISTETLDEIATVIQRKKFDRYFTDSGVSREEFLDNYLGKAIRVEPTELVTDCSDPKDNKFLSLALAANADFLVSGDKKHLLSMTPYRGIRIVTATEFLVDQ